MLRLYPFSAIVGQEALKRALLLNAVRPDVGGVLIRGERGTAKSTAARALAALLPAARALAGCRFGCDPDAPESARCDECRARAEAGEVLAVTSRPTPFIDLPVGATEDRVVGTLDIQRILATGERHFEPGLLASANRGVLYVDEVNLLDDHVVDALLDAAAMGRNFVEREGVSFSHPARFLLIGTMNPEEGDLRPQLTDRFGLSVEVRAMPALSQRVEILRRRMAYDEDPEAFAEAWAASEAGLRAEIEAARLLLPEVQIRDRDLMVTAEIVATAGVDGHRAELAILKAAQANAALEGRLRLTLEDLGLAARLALPHRMRRGLFEGESADLGGIDAVLERHRDDEDEGEPGEAQGSAPGPGPEGGDGRPKEGGSPASGQGQGDATASGEPGGLPRAGQSSPDAGGGDRPVASNEPFEIRPLDASLDRMARRASGRRSLSRSETRRGRYVRAEPAGERPDDIAFDATLRAAAIRQAPLTPGTALAIAGEDLQRKVRMRKTGNLILFLVDASWSMATAERLQAAKGAVMSLLVDAYQRRDRVALAVFRRRGTQVVLPFTASVSMAQRRLREVAVGGKTPLSHALYTADTLFARELARDATALPMLVLLTDGAGNISMTGRPPAEEARRLAGRLRGRGVRSLVIDLYSQRGMAPHSPAADLARWLDGELCPLASLQADQVLARVRSRLAEGG
jgi:magnesium chelatase subunit D